MPAPATSGHTVLMADDCHGMDDHASPACCHGECQHVHEHVDHGKKPVAGAATFMPVAYLLAAYDVGVAPVRVATGPELIPSSDPPSTIRFHRFLE